MNIRRGASRNKIILILLGAWLLAAGLIFGWFSAESKRFQAEWEGYTTTLKARFEQADAAFGEFARVGDQDATEVALSVLADDLEQLTPPQPPQFLWIRMGADKAQTGQAQLTQDLPRYIANARMTAVFLDYQQKVAGQLSALALSAGSDEASIRALAQKWQEAVGVINGLAPPEPLAATHGALTDTMQQAQNLINELADLYASGNAAGFKTIYNSYLTQMSQLRTLSTKVRDAANKLDQDRAMLAISIKQNW